jgi:hypothetical protein
MLLSIYHPYLVANTFLMCLPISFVFIDYRPGAAATLWGSSKIQEFYPACRLLGAARRCCSAAVLLWLWLCHLAACAATMLGTGYSRRRLWRPRAGRTRPVRAPP